MSIPIASTIQSRLVMLWVATKKSTDSKSASNVAIPVTNDHFAFTNLRLVDDFQRIGRSWRFRLFWVQRVK